MANVNVLRQIYNVLGVAVGPSPATGYMFSSGNSGVNFLRTLPRVQSVSTSLSIPREDVNQFGQLARIDQIITSPADASWTIDYLLVDGYAEAILGFNAKGSQTFISGLIDGTQQEKNYFLGIAPEGNDLIGTVANANNINVVALGNGVVSNYSLNLAVGQIPRVSITVQGNNQQTYTGSANKASPAINFETALPVVGPQFTLPAIGAYTGVGIVSALRPGDITLSFPRTGSFGDYTSGVGTIHVQGISLSIPLSTDNINQLGNPFPIGKPIQFPINSTLTVDATAADLAESSVATLFCSDNPVNLAFACKLPACDRNGATAVSVLFNNAKLTNRDYSAAIGQNSTVRLTYSNQIGGVSSNYLGQGVVFSGDYDSAAYGYNP